MRKWAPEAEPTFKLFNCETHKGKNTEIEPFEKSFTYTRENMARAILKWSEYTIFSAIALAILKGADIIRIFGADMKGKGYCKEGLENDRLNHNETRWLKELTYFMILKRLCAEHGIEIIRESRERI